MSDLRKISRDSIPAESILCVWPYRRVLTQRKTLFVDGNICIYIYIYIYASKSKYVTVLEGNQKAPFQ